MKNKTALSQFTKNILAFHTSRKINILEKSWFTAIMEINHDSEGKKIAISHFAGNKNGRSRAMKMLFTSLIHGSYDFFIEFYFLIDLFHFC